MEVFLGILSNDKWNKLNRINSEIKSIGFYVSVSVVGPSHLFYFLSLSTET